MNFKKFLALVCSFLMLVSCFGINSKAMEEKPLKFKIVSVGDARAGKTEIWNRFTHDRYSDVYMATNGVTFHRKDCNVNGKPIHLQVWDTAGQNRFPTLFSRYYECSRAIILCIDLKGENFKTQYERWMNEINQYADKDSDGKLKNPVILLGTKCDGCVDEKQQFKDLAKEKNTTILFQVQKMIM